MNVNQNTHINACRLTLICNYALGNIRNMYALKSVFFIYMLFLLVCFKSILKFIILDTDQFRKLTMHLQKIEIILLIWYYRPITP